MHIRLIKVDGIDEKKGFKNGDVFKVCSKKLDYFVVNGVHRLYEGQVEVALINRNFLRDFVSLNNIKTTLVSKQLGKSKGWLTQVMNRTDRGDLSDQELQSIMKQLHVDWTNMQYVNVKATATHAAYRTRPCVYEHAKHKELLQRAFWDGRIVK